VRRGQGNRSSIEHLIEEQTHKGIRAFRRHANGADLPLCFGPDMPLCQVERLASITLRM